MSIRGIYSAINNEQVSIDELAKKVKRAAYLIEKCQAKLKNTEEEISKIVASMPLTGEKHNGGTATTIGTPDEDDLPF